MKKFIAVFMTVIICLGLSTCALRESLPEPDYIELMAQAAADGNMWAGHLAEENWNRCLSDSGSAKKAVSFDDLYLLSKFICFQAGDYWLKDDFLVCVGEVIMNRVDSPEFPDTIREVIFEPGQYEGVNSKKFKELVPSEKCVNAAVRLLQGERLMENYVVFQSDFRLGNVYSAYGDRVLGFTYFCESPNLELYENSKSPSDFEVLRRPEEPQKNSASGDAFRDFKDSSIIVYSESRNP